jgi:dihydroorotate dehydrogenase (NAD+) catalytic subunit
MAEIARGVELLAGLENVTAIELGIPAAIDCAAVQAFAREAAQVCAGEILLILRLPLDQAIFLAPCLDEIELAAISLGAPRGSLAVENGKQVRGRLYGPALFPQALAAVQNLAALGIAVIGAGGIHQAEQIEAMLSAGALAVQLDSILWRGGLERPS